MCLPILKNPGFPFGAFILNHRSADFKSKNSTKVVINLYKGSVSFELRTINLQVLSTMSCTKSPIIDLLNNCTDFLATFYKNFWLRLFPQVAK